jgi:hypothetical protein
MTAESFWLSLQLSAPCEIAIVQNAPSEQAIPLIPISRSILSFDRNTARRLPYRLS